MSDNRIENSIVLSISLMTNAAISKAGFDKTIKAIAELLILSGTGEYRLRYQDAIITAYAVNSEADYTGKEVFVLVPGNDMTRQKTILGPTSKDIQTDNTIKKTENLYNQVGTNLVTDGAVELISSNEINLLVLYIIEDTEDKKYRTDDEVDFVNKIELDSLDVQLRYIKLANGIAVGMRVRTSFGTGQVGGDYGVKFELMFKTQGNGDAAVRLFTVSSRDVLGNPYAVISLTLAEHLYSLPDILDFIGIRKITAYTGGFPLTATAADIFISLIKINAANPLSLDQLSGYTLFIDYSTNGNRLDSNKISLSLEAQLKIKGRIATKNVSYYWFRLNGLVFRNSPSYCSYGGDGWECLNPKGGKTFVGYTNPNFTILPLGGTNADDPVKQQAVVKQIKTKILCVAVFNSQPVSGELLVYNDNITKSIYISSSDKKSDGETNKDTYYLNHGSPTLTCEISEKEEGATYTYTWSTTPSRGTAKKEETSQEDLNEYKQIEEDYNKFVENFNKMTSSDQKSYEKENEVLKNKWDSLKNTPRVEGNVYYNVPIRDINGSSKISCAVKKNEIYIGTASITLYNKLVPLGSYTLNIENGSQTFQYSTKGVSPASKALEKPLKILPLSFTLLDNEGQQITALDVRNANGIIKWIIPATQTLLKGPEGGKKGTDYQTFFDKYTDLPLSAKDYLVYETDTLSFSIEDTYDSKKNINYIWLSIDYKTLHFDAYTNFSIPKTGDPGTNGTSYIAKIVPMDGEKEKLDTRYIYIYDDKTEDNGDYLFIDTGLHITGVDLALYNNSVRLNGVTSSISPLREGNSYFTIGSSSHNIVIKKSPLKPIIPSSFDELFLKDADSIVNIIRGQCSIGKKLEGLEENKKLIIKQYAEFVVCTLIINNNNYRFRIKPNTGYQYVMYAEDGTRPDYDNTLPFELIVEKSQDSYFIAQDDSNLNYEWRFIGNFNSLTVNENDNRICTVVPKNTFTGEDLTSAIVCKVTLGDIVIGLIHIPVYMYINRYGHQALNDWDGNSILLGDNIDGTILAPQVGAGTKGGDGNTFTGILMGTVKKTGEDELIGLFGYHKGVRSIFLDADSGDAIFGQNGLISLKPGETSTIANWTINTDNLTGGNITLNSSGYIDINYHKGSITNSGIRIDGRQKDEDNNNIENVLETGSGNFSVSRKEGFLTAKGGGSIAGWEITNDSLKKNRVGLQAPKTITDSSIAFYAGSTAPNSAPFRVNYKGDMTATSGQIGPWSINSKALASTITGENIGLGSRSIKKSVFNTDTNILARFWSADNFAVDNNGKIYSKSGKIGGWTISDNEISANSLRLRSSGSIESNNYNGKPDAKPSSTITPANAVGYRISGDGLAIFNNITANNLHVGNGYFGLGTDKITIDGNTGIISGTGFTISPTYVQFNGLQIENGKITSSSSGGITGGGGSSWSGSGVNLNSGYTVNGEDNEIYIKRLAVDSLNVAGTLSFQGKDVKWQNLSVVSKVSPSYARATGSKHFYLPTTNNPTSASDYQDIGTVVITNVNPSGLKVWLMCNLEQDSDVE